MKILSRVKKFLPLITVLVAALVALLYLSNIHAQNILLDDFYYFEFFKRKPLGEIIGQLLIGIHTGHIRFVFIPHLLFIPFYKYTSGLNPIFANLFFLGGLLTLVSTAVMSIKLSAGKSIATWYTSILFFVFTLVNFQMWVMLDFKLGMYILLGLAALLIVLMLLRFTDLMQIKNRLILLLAFIVALHTMDLNLLLLFPIAIVVFATKIPRLAKIKTLLPFFVYPPLYIFTIMQIRGRPSDIFTEAVDLGKVVNWIMTNHYLGQESPIFITCVALLGIGLFVLFRKKQRGIKSNFAILTSLFLLLLSFAIVFSTAIAYNGYVNPHQYAISYLTMVCSILASFGYLMQHLAQRPKVLIAFALLAIGFSSGTSNLSLFLTHTKLRGQEIKTIESFRNHFEINWKDYGEVNYIILEGWPNTVTVPSYSYPAFYNIDWLYESVSKLYLNKDGKRFMILSQNSLSNMPFLEGKLNLYSPNIDSILTVVDYKKEVLNFVNFKCGIFCEEIALSMLKSAQL